MIREKVVIRFRVSRIMEIDGVDSMEKTLQEAYIEYTDLHSLLIIVVETIVNGLRNTFRFL